MKKIILITLVAVWMSIPIASAQHSCSHSCSHACQQTKTSTVAQQLVNDLHSLGHPITLADTAIAKRYNMRQIDGQWFISAIVNFKENVDIQSLSIYGIRVSRSNEKMMVCQIPAKNFTRLYVEKGIEKIDILSTIGPSLQNSQLENSKDNHCPSQQQGNCQHKCIHH